MNIERSLLPPNYCVPDPFEPWKCIVDAQQWRWTWYDPGGSSLPQPGCADNYVGTGLVLITCGIPLGAINAGRVRGELCRTVYPSSACVETRLTVYFDVVP